ncbi:hypothetical protein [Flavobacterium xinjiangense]|uniref:Uncharacterized protein n=1 Tax=Flavobacterium xinjiangense TaxID=178356 RepID=A0A1M7PSJ7_9FLAO|nr:hypothetical protein [Flavobacterium xinjiangense]SHN20280.1 hypothetical protein SAMN05216269_1223 [Flavobacterium xinjiangense]
MNYLIARKKRTNNTYYNIITEKQAEFYTIPDDLNPSRPFDNNYSLEEDEWFGIQNFTETEYCIPILQGEFNSAVNNQIGNNEYLLVKFFCAYQSDNFYCFQKFSSGTLISRKWFNLREPILKSDQPIFILKEIPDAVYVKDVDTLYFKKLTDLKTIFPNIFDLYKEATDAQTETFLANDFINLDESYTTDMVKSANRKRIAMATETLANLDLEQRNEIHTYIRGYCPNLSFSEENSTFDIVNEEHLKLLIFGIEQRFYTTLVGNERRVANSISRIDTQ